MHCFFNCHKQGDLTVPRTPVGTRPMGFKTARNLYHDHSAHDHDRGVTGNRDCFRNASRCRKVRPP